MIKQEIIKRLKDVMPEDPINDFQRGKAVALTYALELVEELEKPIVPQFIDTWIQGAKYNGFDLYEAMTDEEMPVNVAIWIFYNSETFAKALLFGYEVEGKLYTVRLKIISVKKFSYIEIEKNGKRLFISDSGELTDAFQTHFTQTELEELGIWNNPLFEIEEVEE